ncbi:flagellar export protein FliJ [Enterococcus saccharolyticus]|uniref:Flagellar FliJ protein n=1 Tax=Candidatus Enterococcus willemsii TaxID=1857215 RepID=A0ABQ6YWD4_9ENTE|nr:MULTISPECIES: flagellar export protein FliJ [Enterococcus]KAF1302011.1 flagellar export protein FliJ [Enterococcus sp. CU12B]MCD5002882.1 flagellar export protein FliJ [Enterococcus saccharolyticus]
MEKFQFSLEKVLDYRWLQEQDAKRVYASAQKALNEQESILQQIKQEKNELMEIRETTVNRMQVQQWYLLDLNQRLVATTQTIQEMRQYVATALQNYITAQKERKILEKLSEKQLEEYQLAANREEQKMLDEMASRRRIS